MIPRRLAFAGTPEFAATHLTALIDSPHELVAVLTQPDRRSGRGGQARPGPVKTVALSHGIETLQPTTLRDAAAQAKLAALDLDALIVVAYGLLLPQAVLDIPRFGCINVHGSLLPRWRGAAPVQRAIEAGDAESGVTIMRMDAGLDTGPMLAARSCPIAPLATSADLFAQLGQLGPDLLLEVLEDLPRQIERGEVQDENAATYAAKISKAEAQLDWREPAPLLARRVRAFNPAPGTYTFLGEERIKVWEAGPAPANAGDPGDILFADHRGIAVACGEGSLLLHMLQLPGARALGAEELLRGRAELFAPGRRFALPS